MRRRSTSHCFTQTRTRQRTTAAWFVTDFTAVRAMRADKRIQLLHCARAYMISKAELLTLAHPYHQYQFLFGVVVLVVQNEESQNDLYMVLLVPALLAECHRLLKMIRTLYKTFILLIILLSIRSFISFVGFSGGEQCPAGDSYLSQLTPNMCTYVCNRWPQYCSPLSLNDARFIRCSEYVRPPQFTIEWCIYRLSKICSPPI